jgi:hypothetical protein
MPPPYRRYYPVFAEMPVTGQTVNLLCSLCTFRRGEARDSLRTALIELSRYGTASRGQAQQFVWQSSDPT